MPSAKKGVTIFIRMLNTFSMTFSKDVSNTSLDFHNADLKGVDLVENILDNIKSDLSLI